MLDIRLPTDPVFRAMLDAAMPAVFTFSLVLVRVSGLTMIGPLFGQAVVPTNVRALLVFTIALVVTPTLAHQWSHGFNRLDTDHSGRLERNEVPDRLLRRYDARLDELLRDPRVGLERDEFPVGARIPATALEHAALAAGELAIGLMLGLGVYIVLSGLTLAGQLIDQQSGLALGEIVNPGLGTDGSITGQFLYLLGVTVFLLVEPFGGHVMVVTSLVETFETMPTGEAFLTHDAIGFASALVHGSLVIAIQVAAPVLAAMSLVALTMGFLGHTVPQINVLVVGFPVRALVSIVILGFTLSGTSRLVVDAVPRALEDMVRHITQVQ